MGKGNFFTPVCHSVHSGDWLPSIHHRSHDSESACSGSVQGGLPGWSVPSGGRGWTDHLGTRTAQTQDKTTLITRGGIFIHFINIANKVAGKSNSFTLVCLFGGGDFPTCITGHMTRIYPSRVVCMRWVSASTGSAFMGSV